MMVVHCAQQDDQMLMTGSLQGIKNIIRLFWANRVYHNALGDSKNIFAQQSLYVEYSGISVCNNIYAMDEEEAVNFIVTFWMMIIRYRNLVIAKRLCASKRVIVTL